MEETLCIACVRTYDTPIDQARIDQDQEPDVIVDLGFLVNA
jgi:hypothetical protein